MTDDKIPKVTICPACFFARRPGPRTCPNCGFEKPKRERWSMDSQIIEQIISRNERSYKYKDRLLMATRCAKRHSAWLIEELSGPQVQGSKKIADLGRIDGIWEMKKRITEILTPLDLAAH